MPYKIEKRSGPRPWKIVRADTGKVVGSSTSKGSAAASVRARYSGEHKASEPIRNMQSFVHKIAEQTLAEEREIEGCKYTEIPDSTATGMSGSIAAAFGVKKQDNKMWCPSDRIEELKQLMDELNAEFA